MKIHEKFWDRIAASYARRPVADEEAYRRKLEQTQAYLTPDSEVFEFGCGTGSTAIHHAPHVKRILAIDVSQKMIDIARSKAAAENIRNIRFETGSIEDVNVADGTYDVVMAHSILHLLKNKDRALTKAHAMLKPAGVLVSSTTCMGDSWILKAVGFAVSALSYTGLLPYIDVFSTEELVESIERTGFVIEDQWRPTAGSALFVIARKP